MKVHRIAPSLTSTIFLLTLLSALFLYAAPIYITKCYIFYFVTLINQYLCNYLSLTLVQYTLQSVSGNIILV